MVGYLFSGQGSQYIGMGRELYETFPESRTVFDKAEEILGIDLKKYCFSGPEETLKLTSISQPAILTVSIAAFVAFKAKVNAQPAYGAGLSLGEYTALIAAGSLSLEEGLKVVRKRSEIMEETAKRRPGKMIAILDLDLAQIKEICIKTKAEIANINSPGQVVISGEPEAVDKAMDFCLQAGAKRAIPLEVSGGFHSTLMSEASEQLKEILDETSVSEPAFAIISNYTARPENNVLQIKENLVRQMYSPVKWDESMRFMLSEGISQFFEFGPAKVLKGIMRRIEANAEVITIERKDDILNF